MPFIDNESRIDPTPITIRAYCENCHKVRLHGCVLVDHKQDYNVVKSTCLTCLKETIR